MQKLKRLVLAAVVMLTSGVLVPCRLMADPMGCIPVNVTNPGGSVVATTSCSQTEVTQTTYATSSVNAYQTTITAQLGSGSFLFDASFDLPYSDAFVQAAVQQAENDLLSAGATSYSGPTLVSSTLSSSSSVSTVTSAPVDTGNNITGGTITFGPAVIQEGNLGLCQSLVAGNDGGVVPVNCNGQGISFPVLAGQTDININVDEVFNVNQVTTTTNTALTAQTYNLEGVATASPVPEPASLCLLGTGLLTIVGTARRRLLPAGCPTTRIAR